MTCAGRAESEPKPEPEPGPEQRGGAGAQSTEPGESQNAAEPRRRSRRDPAMAPLSRALLFAAGAALLSQPLAVDAAGAAADVTTLLSRDHFERFATQHKPGLNKAIFFSKLGSSSLCDKLAAAFAGRLDFAIVSNKDATGLEDQFDVGDEFPALRIVLKSGGAGAAQELNVASYDGGFKFGAFDEISAWLESEGHAVDEVAGAVQLSHGDELTEHCGGTAPCVVLLTEGDSKKHVALATELAALHAGEVVTVLQLDASAWPDAAASLGVKPAKKTKKLSGAAVFIGPMMDEKGNQLYLHRVLQGKPKHFTASGMQRFIRSSMSLAAESVDAGEAAEGLSALRRLPQLNTDGVPSPAPEEEDEKEEDGTMGVDTAAPTKKEKKAAAAAKAGAEKHQPKKASSSGDTATGDGGKVARLKAKAVAAAAAEQPLMLLAVVAAAESCPGCAKAESLFFEASGRGVTAVSYAMVSLPKGKKALAADLARLDIKPDQLPVYRFYRDGIAWDWEAPWPHTTEALLAEVTAQAAPGFTPVDVSTQQSPPQREYTCSQCFSDRLLVFAGSHRED